MTNISKRTITKFRPIIFIEVQTDNKNLNKSYKKTIKNLKT